MTDDEQDAPRNEASVTRLPSRGGGLPQVVLDMRTLHSKENKVLTGALSGDAANVIVEIQDGFLFCRGEQAALVHGGVAKAEWLPGVPGNGRFAHVVMLTDSLRQVHRIYIRVWSHSPLVFEVRLPISDAVRSELEIWKVDNERRASSRETASSRADAACSKHNNVVPLRPRN